MRVNTNPRETMTPNIPAMIMFIIVFGDTGVVDTDASEITLTDPASTLSSSTLGAMLTIPLRYFNATRGCSSLTRILKTEVSLTELTLTAPASCFKVMSSPLMLMTGSKTDSLLIMTTYKFARFLALVISSFVIRSPSLLLLLTTMDALLWTVNTFVDKFYKDNFSAYSTGGIYPRVE